MYNKYPKLTVLAVFYVCALILAPVLGVIARLLFAQLGIISVFILGFLYSFSFAGGFASLMLLSYESFTFSYAVVAALGAMTADFILIRFIQLELSKEFSLLFAEPSVRWIFKYCGWAKPAPVRVALGIFCIGSPLPDELGVILLSSVRELHPTTLLTLSFFANLVGIYFISALL